MIKQELLDYGHELSVMDDPRDDDSNIDNAVSAKLATESKEDEATWLAESITELDSEELIGLVNAHLNKPCAESAEALANKLCGQLCDYMRNTIIKDWESQEPDTALPEDMIDHYEETKIRMAA